MNSEYEHSTHAGSHWLLTSKINKQHENVFVTNRLWSKKRYLHPFTEYVRCNEMKHGTLSEQIYAGTLACHTQWNYVDVSNWQGNGDRFACLTIDCYPLAQLNTNLHLYDKQLNWIQALVFCCLSISSHLRVLHYSSSLHPCAFTHSPRSLRAYVTTASLFALNSGQMK